MSTPHSVASPTNSTIVRISDRVGRASLRAYFGALPVARWFNPNAPRVKSGEVDPAAYDEASALTAMQGDRLLVRRPLMQVGGERRCGFEAADVDAWIGLSAGALSRQDDLQSCSSPLADCPPRTAQP